MSLGQLSVPLRVYATVGLINAISMIDGADGLAAGFGPTEVAVALSLFSALCGLLAGQALRMDVPHPLILLTFFMLCAAWFWMTGRRNRATRFFHWVRNFGAMGHRKTETN